MLRSSAFFQQIPFFLPVVFDPGIVAGDHIFHALLVCILHQTVEFQIAVAVDAGVGRTAIFIDADKLLHNLLSKLRRKIRHGMGDIQLKRHLGGVVDIRLAAAGVGEAAPDIRIAEQAHGHAHAVVALPQHQPRRHGAVHAAAHGDEGGLFIPG